MIWLSFFAFNNAKLLLDPDATAYGTTIASHAANFVPNGDIYNAFEYKLPTGASYDLTTISSSDIVAPGQSATIVIPAGIYDYYIVNPSPDQERAFIAQDDGDFDGSADNYYFEPGKTYILTITENDGNGGERVDLTHPMSEWTVVEINSNTASYSLDELVPNTHYEWQVQGINDNNTNWSATANFTTALFTVPAGIWQAISTPVHDNGQQYVSTTNVDGQQYVSITNVDGLTKPAYDLFRYNESSGTWENQKSGDNAVGFNTLEVGRGYIYRCNPEHPLSFNGVTNFGDYSVQLTANGNGDLGGFNLVGNPYPYSVLVDRAFYSLNADGTWLLHPDGGNIDMAQGILVYTDNSNGETLTFDATNRRTNTGSKGNLPPLPATFCLSDNCDDASHYQLLPATHFALFDGSHLVITATGTLQAYDIMGRLIFSKEITTPYSTISTLNFPASGVYILHLAGQSQKIVIR